MQSDTNDNLHLDKRRHTVGNLMHSLLLKVVHGLSYMNKLGLKYNQNKWQKYENLTNQRL